MSELHGQATMFTMGGFRRFLSKANSGGVFLSLINEGYRFTRGSTCICWCMVSGQTGWYGWMGGLEEWVDGWTSGMGGWVD